MKSFWSFNYELQNGTVQSGGLSSVLVPFNKGSVNPRTDKDVYQELHMSKHISEYFKKQSVKFWNGTHRILNRTVWSPMVAHGRITVIVQVCWTGCTWEGENWTNGCLRDVDIYSWRHWLCTYSPFSDCTFHPGIENFPTGKHKTFPAKKHLWLSDALVNSYPRTDTRSKIHSDL